MTKELSKLAYAIAEHRGFGGSLPPSAKSFSWERRLGNTLHWRLSLPKWKSEHPIIEVGVSELIKKQSFNGLRNNS